jgi:GST-like protein
MAASAAGGLAERAPLAARLRPPGHCPNACWPRRSGAGILPAAIEQPENAPLDTLYAATGAGSAIVEGLAALAGIPLHIETVDPWESEADKARLAALNPLIQVPTLVLADGTVMTESAAITLLFDDRAPEAELVPRPGAAERPRFLRWLVFLVGSLYPTFTYGDVPERYVPAEAAGALRASTDAQREAMWRLVEAAFAPAPWLFGDRPTALDVYVTVMSHWRPRRAWFADHCPKLFAVARAGDAHPVLGPVLGRNFG